MITKIELTHSEITKELKNHKKHILKLKGKLNLLNNLIVKIQTEELKTIK